MKHQMGRLLMSNYVMCMGLHQKESMCSNHYRTLKITKKERKKEKEEEELTS
jgi:hypothetical protein